MLTAAPNTLNGYPVVNQHKHERCATVLVEKPNEYVVATWFPSNGNGWSWGHYFPYACGTEIEAFVSAHADFAETANRNALR